MDTKEVTVFKNTIYRGKILNLRVDIAGLPNGKEAPREFVEHSGGVTVAALTDDAELIFVRQFRYPYMQPLVSSSFSLSSPTTSPTLKDPPPAQ